MKWRVHVRAFAEFVSWWHLMTLSIIIYIRYYPLSLSKLRRTFLLDKYENDIGHQRIALTTTRVRISPVFFMHDVRQSFYATDTWSGKIYRRAITFNENKSN